MSKSKSMLPFLLLAILFFIIFGFLGPVLKPMIGFTVSPLTNAGLACFGAFLMWVALGWR